ncbi:unnamed protein product [marine sediment metagenome]|uniref:Uncharacterized protein n=1 Tax=marine sediment metagenome TaxID=412755 RepID=X0VWY9_9ZZZZ
MTNDYAAFPGRMLRAVVQVGATSGDQTIIAAPGASKAIWVTGYRLRAQTAVGVQWRDTGGTVAVTHSGTMYMDDDGKGGVGEPVSPYPCFQLANNMGLVLNLDGAQKVGGYVTYRVTPNTVIS